MRFVYAEWERGDFSSIDWAAEDFELVFADGPVTGRWRGRAEVAGAWAEMLDAWEGLRTQTEEFRELDDGRLLVLTRNTGRGKASGLELGVAE